jgi:RNA polymerase sigma factor (sigma-70 family)
MTKQLPESDKEKTLVQDVLSGSRFAFNVFISSYQRLAMQIIFKIVKDEDDRKDILQETFIKAYNNLSGFRFQSKLGTWVGRIAYHTALNFIEKKRPRAFSEFLATPDELPGDQFSNLLANDPDPEEVLSGKDLQNQLETAVAKLPVLWNTAFTLYHQEEQSYEEIAEIMNIPVGTVKTYIFRARKNLKDQLIKEFRS